MSTPQERVLQARLAAHMSWANTPDRSARTAAGRAALDRRFLEEADGDPVRAEHLRKAHYARLALRSAKARRRAREQTAVAEQAEAELAEAAEVAAQEPARRDTNADRRSGSAAMDITLPQTPPRETAQESA